MPKVTMRKERRKEQRERYVSRVARRPHSHTPSLDTSLLESSESSDRTMDESSAESSLNTSDQSLSGVGFDIEEVQPTGHQESRQGNPNDVCPKCAPILLRYTKIFKSLVHQGTELKKRKKANPNPKRAGIPYREVKRQNDWLQGNVFDAMGN